MRTAGISYVIGLAAFILGVTVGLLLSGRPNAYAQTTPRGLWYVSIYQQDNQGRWTSATASTCQSLKLNGVWAECIRENGKWEAMPSDRIFSIIGDTAP